MGIFVNNIVKKTAWHLIITFILIVLIGSIITVIYSNITIQELVEYDMSLVGALYENKNIEDISIITGEIVREDYQRGKDILSEYSYGTNISSIMDHYRMVFLRNITIFLIVITIFFVILLLIFYNSFTRIFLNIKKINSELQVGDITDMSGFSDADGGEIAILKSSINSLLKRSLHHVGVLNQDKQQLQKMLVDISHQLKTPLTAIRMYNEIMLSKSNINPAIRADFLRQSREQIDRIDWLVQGLLKIARLEANSIEMFKKSSYLADTIDTAISPLYALAKKNNIAIIIKAASEIILTHDSQWVAEALGNIIKNAIEHNKKGGYVKIISEESPMTVEIRIKDNGEGIRKKDLVHIFKRFFQVEGQKASSIGIGLELAKEILERNDADIYVQSEFGIGTEFIITFLKKS